MNNKTRNQILTAINFHVESAILSHLREPNKSTYVDLVQTLKYWGTPGAYSKINEVAASPSFEFLDLYLKHPEKILPSHENDFTENDKAEILAYLRYKIDRIAENLIQRYKLQSEIQQRKDKNIQHWWEEKTKQEQIEIEEHHKHLPLKLQDRICVKVGAGSNDIRIVSVKTQYLYYMCEHSSELTKKYLKNTAQLDLICSPLNVFAQPKRILSDNSVNFTAYLGIKLISFLSGITPALYALRKTYHSIRNLFSRKKILRSLARLGGIGVGAGLGAFIGSAIFPGIGSIVGGAVGGALGAGLSAFATKHVARTVTGVKNAKKIISTNPEKYELTQAQQATLQTMNLSYSKINQMLLNARNEKSKYNAWNEFPNIPGSIAYERKAQLNTMVGLLRTNNIRTPIWIADEPKDPREQPLKPANDDMVSHQELKASPRRMR